MELIAAERQHIKTVARELLSPLKAREAGAGLAKAAAIPRSVRLFIEDYLDKLPDSYDQPVFEATVKLSYQHVYDMYPQTALVE